MVLGLLRSTLRLHGRALYRQFSPIEHSGPVVKLDNRLHFGLPLLVILLSTLLGTFYLPLETALKRGQPVTLGSWSQTLSWVKGLTTDPAVVFHQVVPSSMWVAYDTMTVFTIITGVIMLWYAVLEPQLDERFVMKRLAGTGGLTLQFTVGQLPLDRTVSAAIDRFRKRILTLAFGFIVPAYLFFMGFYYFNVLRNGAYTLSWPSALYWGLLFPPLIFYLYYAIFAFQSYAIFSSRIIRIRQVQLIEQLSEVIPKESALVLYGRRQAADHLPARQEVVAQWRRFLQLNFSLLHICRHTTTYCRLNGPTLSAVVPYQSVIPCYFLTVLLYGGHEENFTICIAAIAEFSLIVYLVINECAMIERQNRAMEEQMAAFYIKASASGSFKVLPIVSALKSELLASHHRLRPYVFAIGNYRITKTTFQNLLVYTSSFFMYIVTSSRNK